MRASFHISEASEDILKIHGLSPDGYGTDLFWYNHNPHRSRSGEIFPSCVVTKSALQSKSQGTYKRP